MNYFKISRRNKQIYQNGAYTTENDVKIDIAELSSRVRNTLHKEITLAPELKRKKAFRIETSTMRCSTIECILRLRRDGFSGNITALNFANAFMPGGAYILGGNAQEESLCRASTLYYELRKCMEIYWHNRLRLSPLYSDYMIYSRNVPIISDDSGKLLEKPYTASFLTSPAVNRSFARFICPQSKINRVMETRIKKLVSLAVSENSDAIILGAFGCGMFGNKRKIVYPMIENAVNTYVPDSIKVIFSVI